MYSGEYGGILLGLALCLVLAIVFAGLSYVVSAKQADVEKYLHMSVDLIHLMIHVKLSMFDFI